MGVRRIVILKLSTETRRLRHTTGSQVQCQCPKRGAPVSFVDGLTIDTFLENEFLKATKSSTWRGERTSLSFANDINIINRSSKLFARIFRSDRSWLQKRGETRNPCFSCLEKNWRFAGAIQTYTYRVDGDWWVSHCFLRPLNHWNSRYIIAQTIQRVQNVCVSLDDISNSLPV